MFVSSFRARVNVVNDPSSATRPARALDCNLDATCVTVTLNVPCANDGSGLVASAYLGDFNPTALCESLIGRSGLDAVNGTGGFSFRVPAGGQFTVVVNEHNFEGPFQGCGNYSLELRPLRRHARLPLHHP